MPSGWRGGKSIWSHYSEGLGWNDIINQDCQGIVEDVVGYDFMNSKKLKLVEISLTFKSA